MYGRLTIVTGPMFSGKTSHLVKTVRSRDDTIVFKPAMDIRYSEEECVTHTGDRVAAMPVALPDDMMDAQTAGLICIDEVQFFTAPHYAGDIIKTIKVFLKAGKDVMACGLDIDWRGDAFPISAALTSMADEVIKLKSACSVCTGPASKTYKKSRDGAVVELGSSEVYEPRCNHHWSAPH